MGGRFLEAFAELAWPTRCIGCDLPGTLLCDECRERLPWIEQRLACPICGTPFGYLSCSGCRRGMKASARTGRAEDDEGLSVRERLARDWPMRTTICALCFQGTAAQMATGLKDAHERRLAPIMAAAMTCALDEAASWDAPDGRPRYDGERLDALCYVPATPEAYARRGFDHMELVARPLSGFTGIPLADVLVRDTGLDQRALGRAARSANLARTIAVVDDVAGLDLLLVDDVPTTGASLAAATHALLARGAASVTACTFARAW